MLISAIVIGFLVLIIFYILMDDLKSTNKINRRIDGLHERLDNLRDMIMEKQDNEIREIKKGLTK